MKQILLNKTMFSLLSLCGSHLLCLPITPLWEPPYYPVAMVGPAVIIGPAAKVAAPAAELLLPLRKIFPEIQREVHRGMK